MCTVYSWSVAEQGTTYICWILAIPEQKVSWCASPGSLKGLVMLACTFSIFLAHRTYTLARFETTGQLLQQGQSLRIIGGLTWTTVQYCTVAQRRCTVRNSNRNRKCNTAWAGARVNTRAYVVRARNRRHVVRHAHESRMSPRENHREILAVFASLVEPAFVQWSLCGKATLKTRARAHS